MFIAFFSLNFLLYNDCYVRMMLKNDGFLYVNEILNIFKYFVLYFVIVYLKVAFCVSERQTFKLDIRLKARVSRKTNVVVSNKKTPNHFNVIGDNRR